MKIAVMSCWEYRDCWGPFFKLLDIFWPDHPDTILISDVFLDWSWFPEENVRAYSGPTSPPWDWCKLLQQFAGIRAITDDDDIILLMQEDFWLTAPVKKEFIDHGHRELAEREAGCARLYPMPGADKDYGDPLFGKVTPGTPYRISCQASLWRPSYLARLASQVNGGPANFEIDGTRVADKLPEPVLAWKREVQPWPVEYLCSAITRKRWNPDAKKLCDAHGIEVDWSLRPFHVAR